MQRTEFYTLLHDQYHDIETFSEIERTCRKVLEHFETHEKILVSVSGGADSDCVVHLLCRYFPEYLHKCSFVYVDTGLEYEATKRHIHELKQRYNIEIEKIRGVSVVTACNRYGFPVISKAKSGVIYYYLKGSKWAVERFEWSDSAYAFTEKEKQLITYARDNGIQISDRCCYHSKKAPVKKYIRKNGIDLNVTGERLSEGGQRAMIHKSCFEEHKDGISKFMPLWWWSNKTRNDFIFAESIKLSDCYTVYGMRRTGCVGCPFNSKVCEDLQRMKRYEPKLYKACINVFGKSYALMDLFKVRKSNCVPDDLEVEYLLKGGKL